MRPDYDFEGKGVLIEGIVPGGPAEMAGLKKGDVILEIAGKATPNLAAYTAVLAALKVDVAIDIKILREKTEMTLKATPK